jgi:nickel-type superoxide dismutase maturation protease
VVHDLIETLLWILRRRRRFQIVGASMVPAYADGDEVLVNPRAYKRRRPEPGHVVLATHPTIAETLIVKRVERIEPDGRLFVVGDNPDPLASTDSRQFGAIRVERVQGRVVGRFW